MTNPVIYLVCYLLWGAMLAVSYRPMSDFILVLFPDGLNMPIVTAFIGATMFFVTVIAFDQLRIVLTTPLLMLWDKLAEKVPNRFFRYEGDGNS